MATVDGNIDRILEKLPQLAVLVLETPSPSTAADEHAESLHSLLAALEQDSADAGLRGTPYLFRLLYKLPISWPNGTPADADHDAFTDWLAELADHLLIEADEAGPQRLLGHLRRLSWMPPLPPALTTLVGEALVHDAAALRRRAAMALPSDPGAAGDAADGRPADAAGKEREPSAAAGVLDAAAAADAGHGLLAHAAPATEAVASDAAASAVALGDDAGAEAVHDNGIGCDNDLVDATVDTAVCAPGTSSAADAPWISAEEMALIADAVATQLLPATAAAADALAIPGPGTVPALEACIEQLSLIQAALDALELRGLRQLSDGYAALLQRLLQGSDADAADVAAAGLWPVLLLCHLQDPLNIDIARDLGVHLVERGLLTPEQASLLADSLVAVRIGVDPQLREQRARVVGAEDVELHLAADVLPSVLNGMLSELPKRTAEFSRHLQNFLHRRQGADLAAARRIAHTLKGDGNIVGLRGIANLTHALEEIFDVLANRPEHRDPALDEMLVDAADMLEVMSDHVLGRGPEPADAVALLQRVIDGANALLDDAGGLQPPASGDGATESATPAAAADEPAADDADTTTVTIPMRLLDQLLRQTGEATIYARQVENRVERVERRHGEITAQGKTFATLIAELQQLVEVRGAALSSLRLNLGEEFDDLEMDRYNELHTVTLRLVEASADARASAGELNDDVIALHDLLARQDRIHQDLRERVQRARTVPLLELLPRLQRVVRQTARQIGKPCELQIDGGDTLLDKELLDGLAEPLLHLLRNAIDHGIETPELRAIAAKPPAGQIRLSFGRDGGDVVIVCHDDGTGLDYERIRRRATERGLIAAERSYSEAELAELIFHAGFSTRHGATLTSGRGLGMDIVRRRVTALKGSVSLRSNRGQGCTVELRLPSSQVTAQVLLVRVGSERVAVNLTGVQRLALYAPSQLNQYDGQLQLQLDDEAPCRAVHLAQLLGLASPTPASGRHAMLLTGSGERTAVLIDEPGDARSVIVKGLGMHVAPNPGVLGATILGDGGIATVVDLPQLLARLGRLDLSLSSTTPAGSAEQVPSVLVVDDSLSVRRSLEQVIGDAGFRVSSARDGLEAVAQVRERQPDVLVIDLEMPRMNGLELTSFIRRNEDTRHIPIIMITSRTTERHRDLARNAGVDTVLSKPYSEEGLLALIVDKLTRSRADRRSGAAAESVAASNGVAASAGH